jgi:hypothetical protein
MEREEEEARHRLNANRERKSGLDTAENAMMCVLVVKVRERISWRRVSRVVKTGKSLLIAARV